MATNSDMTRENTIASAKSFIICNTIPSENKKGTNTTIVVRVEPTMADKTSLVPR